MRLGLSDAGNDPRLDDPRAYDLLAEGFGPGFNGPLLIVVEDPRARAADRRRRAAPPTGVAFVADPHYRAATGRSA